VIHDVMLALFRVSRMFSQPSHGGAPAIEFSVLGIDFHAAKFRSVIEPFTAETYAFYHVLIVTYYRQLSTTKGSPELHGFGSPWNTATRLSSAIVGGCSNIFLLPLLTGLLLRGIISHL
jgi:hypothetical protein